MGNSKRFDHLTLCGPTLPDSACVPLHCGPLRLAFDPETGAVRCVVLENQEILRGIYFAARDSNWETVSPHIYDIQIKSAEDGFHVGFVARCQSHDIEIVFSGDISGDFNSTIRYVLDGQVRGGKLVVVHTGNTRIVEAAIPWSEIPEVKACKEARMPIKFSFRINDNAGVGCMELSRGRSVAKHGGSFHVDWVEHWENQVEFCWGK